nr:DUF4286 family protein [uncultured Albidiferax sp.]
MQAFLALWNSVAPEVQDEYEAWHSLEHVPERTALPGFIETWRYRALHDPLRYFTCYALDSLAALDTPGYREVMAQPSPWSARMRPALRDFVRLPCTLRGAVGVSTAAQLVVTVLDIAPENIAACASRISARALNHHIVCAHWGQLTDLGAYPVADLGNQASNALAQGAHRHVLMLQGVNPARLLEQAQQLCAELAPYSSTVIAPEAFGLLSHTRHDALDTATRLAPRMDLFAQFQPTGDKT